MPAPPFAPPRKIRHSKSGRTCEGRTSVRFCAAVALAVYLGQHAVHMTWLGHASKDVKNKGRLYFEGDSVVPRRSHTTSTSNAELTGTRRSLFNNMVVGTGAAVSWPIRGEPAEAFRIDRIKNAQKTYGPKIRANYQKLAGLRDDIKLEVEVEGITERYVFQARVAEWYDGVSRNLIGSLVLPPSNDDNHGCKEYDGGSVAGKVVIMARGKCDFATKVKLAKAAGAKAAIVYDDAISLIEETVGTNLTGAVRSKGIAVRGAGDGLSGGTYLVPRKKGMTVMAPPEGQSPPQLGAVMLVAENGTTIVDALKSGGKAEVTDVFPCQFKDGIDQYIKKDLKRIVAEMEILGNTMRISKDDLKDPIIRQLASARDKFEKAVKAKEYGKSIAAFNDWLEVLPPEGKFPLTETK